MTEAFDGDDEFLISLEAEASGKCTTVKHLETLFTMHPTSRTILQKTLHHIARARETPPEVRTDAVGNAEDLFYSLLEGRRTPNGGTPNVRTAGAISGSTAS